MRNTRRLSIENNAVANKANEARNPIKDYVGNMKIYLCFLVLTAACLSTILNTAFCQTEFQGSLNSVKISDVGGTNTPPNAQFTYSQDGASYTFDASGSTDTDGTITEYKWDFGNGVLFTGVSVTYNHSEGTDFQATLTVVDDAGGVTLIQKDISVAVPDFYWSMESLPDTTITSDGGNLTITKHLYEGTSSSGVIGKCLEQTGVWQTYKFPMASLPVSKGRITFHLRHIYSSADDNRTVRYIFRTQNKDSANTIYSWIKGNDIWFYVIDANGTIHRAYNTNDSWASGVWYKYSFIWDADAGYIAIVRDNDVVAESNETPWAAATPAWGSQDLFIGYDYHIGSFDEFYIKH